MTSEVHNIDCLELMRTLPDKCFQLAIADPPYRDENKPTEWMKRKSSSKEMFCSGLPTDDFFNELKRVSEEQIIWEGTGERCSEGPHMFFKDGYYYAMVAEGGTGYGHGINMVWLISIWIQSMVIR